METVQRNQSEDLPRAEEGTVTTTPAAAGGTSTWLLSPQVTAILEPVTENARKSPKIFFHDHLESMVWEEICCKTLILHRVIRIHVCPLDLADISEVLLKRVSPELGIVKEP
jgi:hypothetical protein